MILYLSFFVVLLVLTLAKSSGKKKRAQKFLQEQINILESVLQNFDSDPKGYEELADKIIKITDDTSEENKNKLHEFLLGHTLSDCFVDKSVTTSKLERDLSLFQVISPQVEMLWKDKSILSPYRSFLKMELISRLEYEGRELMIRFKHAARNRLENLKELA
ncbi:hypothetical protein K9M09_03030 [Patescibacteria group bacterium]|nr:hypothetical protein [Patescibacteria group bacterium]